MNHLFLISKLMVAFALSMGAIKANEAPENNLIDWNDFLEQLGDTHNLYFTIEKAWDKPKVSRGISEPTSVPNFSNDASFREIINALQKSWPEYEITFSKSNSRIIHIKDKQLIGLAKYALNEAVEHIKFSGRMWRFVGYLEKKCPLISNETCFIASPFLQWDYITSVQVDVERSSIRDLLSNHIPLTNYHRIIWETTTDLETTKTKVKFSSPKSGGLQLRVQPIFAATNPAVGIRIELMNMSTSDYKIMSRETQIEWFDAQGASIPQKSSTAVSNFENANGVKLQETSGQIFYVPLSNDPKEANAVKPGMYSVTINLSLRYKVSEKNGNTIEPELNKFKITASTDKFIVGNYTETVASIMLMDMASKTVKLKPSNGLEKEP